MIPVNRPLLDGDEKKYLDECIESGWISAEGPFVKKLEGGFAQLMGCAYGVAVCNGSVAIEVALAALRNRSGRQSDPDNLHHHLMRVGDRPGWRDTGRGRLSA